MERFWSKVQKADSGCWLWTSTLIRNGYGRFWLDGKSQLAHRVSYTWLVGPIPHGRQLDHLCRVRNCVNPEHLEPVTNRENCRRGIAGVVNGGRQRAKTHCPRGHEYSPENTYIEHHGGRRCRTCVREQKRLARSKEAA